MDSVSPVIMTRTISVAMGKGLVGVSSRDNEKRRWEGGSEYKQYFRGFLLQKGTETEGIGVVRVKRINVRFLTEKKTQHSLYAYWKKIRMYRRSLFSRMVIFKRQEGMGTWNSEKDDLCQERRQCIHSYKKKRDQYMGPDAHISIFGGEFQW